VSNGQYEVHYMRVTFPYHIFANQDFTVVGAGWPRWRGTREFSLLNGPWYHGLSLGVC
jgi:hypothetical protein